VPAAVHLVELYVRADRARVWDALLGDATVAWFDGLTVESSLRPGEKIRWVAPDDTDVIEGELEAIDAPHRLTATWRWVADPEARDEPPGRVEWTLVDATADGRVTRLSLRHGQLALSPVSWELARRRWPVALSSLKSLLETGSALPPIEQGDAIDASDVEANWHRAQAVTANNSVWELLDGRALSDLEADELLHRAYAAAYHWRRASGRAPVNDARAAYMIARAHVQLGQGEIAMHRAQRCAQLTEAAGAGAEDFDRAYALEVQARAAAALGRDASAADLRRRAADVEIADDQDRSIFEGDLRAGPWFGLDDA